MLSSGQRYCDICADPIPRGATYRCGWTTPEAVTAIAVPEATIDPVVPKSTGRTKFTKGMGRIFKRGEVWWIAYSYRGREYRETTKTTGSKGETLAGKLLKKRLGEIGRGRLIGPNEEKVTFKSLGADLVNDYSTNDKRSVRSAELSVRHLSAFFGDDRAVDITTDRIRAYIADRQQSGAANASINRELAALKRMFRLAVQANRLSTRPHIPMLDEENARQGFVDHESFLALRDTLPDYLKDPVAFLYFSGWRVSEMRGLEWRDVDLRGRVSACGRNCQKTRTVGYCR